MTLLILPFALGGFVSKSSSGWIWAYLDDGFRVVTGTGSSDADARSRMEQSFTARKARR
jgi:hypothetical protein